MNWEDYKSEFAFDGSWRDIYILRTSIEDWQKIIDFLRSSDYEITYLVDGDKATFPIRAEEAFEARNEFNVFVSINIGSVIVNSNFFDKEEIEFDIDPREIHSEVQAKQVFRFMEQMGILLNKEVILTPENWQHSIIFKFDPVTKKMCYFPDSS